MKYFLFLLLVLFIACSPFRNFKTRQFAYETNNGNKTVSLFIPPGFKKEELQVDSAGNKAQVYHYGNGAFLYFATVKGEKDFQYINKEKNISQPHIQGGIFYKGLDPDGSFWSEVQNGNLRYGYKNVSGSNEVKFDSSLNYVKIMR